LNEINLKQNKDGEKMQIAIIGTGNVGSALGGRWAEKGHRVIYGSRDPESDKVKSLLNSQKSTNATSPKDAAAQAEVVVFATPWPATKEAVKSAGDLAGKIVVDCTNPIAPNLNGLILGQTTSAGETLAEWAKGAFIVKAFNTTGSKNMSDPVYGSEKISMFICGDNVDAKKTISKLASDIDFDVVDCGKLIASRYLEPFAMLWIHLSYVMGLGPDIAFKLLKR
jgi:predicted dinucleotide-binding enzyme